MDLRVSVLNFNFTTIYIVHKILVFIKNHQDNNFKFFFKKYNRLLFFQKSIFFVIYDDGKSKV